MQKVLFILLGSLCLLAASSQAAIIQTASIDDICELVDDETLVIFGLNNTLMVPAQQLGSEHWATEEITNRIKASGKNEAQVLDEFVPLWHKVLLATEVRPTEPTTADTVYSLQKRGCKTLGLTRRYIEMAYPTLNQLRSIDIDLNDSSLFRYDLEIEGGFAAKFIEGILFVGLKNDQGQTLWRFLDAIHFVPKKILFADDALENLNSVQTAALERGVDFIGVHYTHVQGAITPSITAKQMKYLGWVLSDEECSLLLSLSEAYHE